MKQRLHARQLDRSEGHTLDGPDTVLPHGAEGEWHRAALEASVPNRRWHIGAAGLGLGAN